MQACYQSLNNNKIVMIKFKIECSVITVYKCLLPFYVSLVQDASYTEKLYPWVYVNPTNGNLHSRIDNSLMINIRCIKTVF